MAERGGFMSADENEISNSPRRRRRLASSQTLRLEAYFEECQHPNERQRLQLGRELGLTPTQIKFWFQNKRTLVKAQYERLEGNALRAENNRLKCENLAFGDALKVKSLCTPCKGLPFSKEKNHSILEDLWTENAILNKKYEKLSKLVVNMGISGSKVHSPGSGPSRDASIGGFPGPRMGMLSLDHNICSRNFRHPNFLCDLKEMKESDKLGMFQTVVNAVNEVVSLLSIEPLWIKDPTDGRYVIHRDNYGKSFPRINHLKGSRPQFESSKDEGIVRMHGSQLVGILMDSAKRANFFPTIITKGKTIQELDAQSGNLNGSLQLVHEQLHVLSPLVAPREFYLLRYCEQFNEGEWIIVNVSHDFFNESQQSSPFRSWRLPSGCFIKDLSNGCSKVTWVEHVQVDEKALTHPLYRDLIFHGLAYGAERCLLTLQRMCERFAFGMGRTAVSQETGVSTPEGRRSIMNLTHRMVKYLCANLTMKRKLEIPQLAELNSGGIRFSSRKSTGLGQPSGLIVSAATSLRLPLPYQALFDFLSNTEMRSQWDAMSNGNPFQESARISYGDHPGNHISIIQPFFPCEGNMLVLQESCVDPLGAMIVYAPIDIQSVQMAVSGADSSGIPILPSGFIISSDGHPHTGANGASSSTSTANPMSSGSLLTVAFQILTGGDMQLVTGLNALVSSTIQNITSALNCTSLK
ncbi:homeobox-leucine zipper protein HDG11-like [Rhododendron vialii]|uniref:homeobox-leucine zipper protein HDG11-like n=1 Tax=Rhododendron vialii TaxID=182163 RepID=UPI00265E1A8D|nr:homeobox-leucine zipper protein HDG11-like [Rhododendron vialii]XP_058189858.1 homeobox-leucine zipper protein HDG11-like [Rhododendron vialii]XP_058189859.1 homeobox-leucine zipper protein HDG11-like [Rhododendron vialii]XP_058189860.1 homeobox-leucine zipper protein HDG11-like [Rhododendron vialii]XP_058189861.1 homeobox-leucine zipper protein HDG11-like [Rhododendron vialii]